MIARFDRYNRFEVPSMTLCNPGSRYNEVNGLVSNVVCGIHNTSDEELIINFNSPSELNLRAYLLTEGDEDEKKYAVKTFNAIQSRRLIYVDDIGYFIISNVESGRGENTYKDITALSLEYELKQKTIPFIADNTYQFVTETIIGGDTSDEEEGLLNKIMSVLPVWNIGDIDDAVAQRYRTFENVATDTDCLDFMMNQMQDSYECIFEFDIITRTINVYDRESYAKKTDVHLSMDDLITSMVIREATDEVRTALTVRGQDERVTISYLNPLGTNTIYDFSYYIDWMSEELQSAVQSWTFKMGVVRNSYKTLSMSRSEMLNLLYGYQADADMYKIQAEMYKRCMDNIVAEGDTSFVGQYNEVIVANGGTAIDTSGDIEDVLANVRTLYDVAEAAWAGTASYITSYKREIESIESQLDTIRQSVSFTNPINFTKPLLEELNCFIFEGEYIDEFAVFTDSMDETQKFEQMSLLYDRAVSKLKEISRPALEYEVSIENFLFNKEFERWSSQISPGCSINVELDDEDTAELFLNSVTINYYDYTFTMSFGDRLNKKESARTLASNFSSIKPTGIFAMIIDTITPFTNGEYESIKESVAESKNISMGGAFTTKNGEIVIDASGYTSRVVHEVQENGAVIYDNKQLKMSGKMIAITDDSWNSSIPVIGEIQTGDNASAGTTYGVNGAAVAGNLVIGDNLTIKADGGSKVLYKDGSRMCSNIGNKTVASWGSDNFALGVPLKIGNTLLTEDKLQQLLALLS